MKLINGQYVYVPDDGSSGMGMTGGEAFNNAFQGSQAYQNSILGDAPVGGDLGTALGSYGSNQYSANLLGMDMNFSGSQALKGSPINSWSGNYGGDGSFTKAPGSIWDSPLQQRDASGATSGGWLGAGMGIAQGLGSMYLGMKNYGLQKDQLAFGKEQFNKNYSAQKTMTNNNINARNRANQAALGTQYASSYKPLDLVA